MQKKKMEKNAGNHSSTQGEDRNWRHKEKIFTARCWQPRGLTNGTGSVIQQEKQKTTCDTASAFGGSKSIKAFRY